MSDIYQQRPAFNDVADDDARCVSAESVAATTAAFQRLIERIARSGIS